MKALILLIAINLQMLVSLIKMHREPARSEPGAVIMPRFILYIGLILALAAETPAVIMFIMGVHPGAVLGFGILSLLGAAIMRLYTNVRIFYDDEGFKKTYFLGFTLYFRYEELTGLKGTDLNLRLYAGRRVIPLSVLADNRKFLYLAKKMYRRSHNHQDIPKLKSLNGFDIFRGNLKDPGWYSLALIILISVPFTLEGLFLSDYLSTEPYPMDELLLVRGRVQNVEDLRDGLYFSIENREEHFRLTPEALKNPQETLEYLRSGGIVELGGHQHWDRYRQLLDSAYDPHYRVQFLRNGEGRLLLTQEDMIGPRKAIILKNIVVYLPLSLLFEGALIKFLLVGRHPERYSRGTVDKIYRYDIFTDECRKRCKF